MKRNFTLIELLVVISIIAILAAMLLPTLNKARETAMKIKCTSILKNYGNALILYAGSNDDFMPVMMDATFGGVPPSMIWWANDDFRATIGAGAGEGDFWPRHLFDVGAICPKSSAVLTVGPQLSPSGKSRYYCHVSYVAPHHASTDPYWYSIYTAGYAKSFKLSKLPHPSASVAFVDGGGHSVNELNVENTNVAAVAQSKYRIGGEANGFSDSENQIAWERHVGGANNLFYDAHVDFLKSNEAVSKAPAMYRDIMKR